MRTISFREVIPRKRSCALVSLLSHCNIGALVGSVDRERCRVNRIRSNRPTWASAVRDNGCIHKTRYRRRSASFRGEKSRSGDRSEVIQTGSVEVSRPERDGPTRTWFSPPVDGWRFHLRKSIRDLIENVLPAAKSRFRGLVKCRFLVSIVLQGQKRSSQPDALSRLRTGAYQRDWWGCERVPTTNRSSMWARVIS